MYFIKRCKSVSLLLDCFLPLSVTATAVCCSEELLFRCRIVFELASSPSLNTLSNKRGKNPIDADHKIPYSMLFKYCNPMFLKFLIDILSGLELSKGELH